MVEDLLRAWGPAERAGSDEWGLACQPLLHDRAARAAEARRRGDTSAGRPAGPGRREDRPACRLAGW
jgi:hypothetical protein